VIVSVIVR